MSEILHVHYNHCREQNHIRYLQSILDWLGKRGFEITYFNRPFGGSEHYLDVEFLAQRKRKFSRKEREAWNDIQWHPFDEENYK